MEHSCNPETGYRSVEFPKSRKEADKPHLDVICNIYWIWARIRDRRFPDSAHCGAEGRGGVAVQVWVQRAVHPGVACAAIQRGRPRG
jgi:hypothetical protein